MASRKATMLIIAAVVGVGAILAGQGMEPPTAVPSKAQPEKTVTEVAAAARDLPIGTILKEMDLKWIPWTGGDDTSALFVKGTTNLSSLSGAIVRSGFRVDEAIVSGRVVHPRDQGFLAAVLTPGMRAVSIQLSPSAEVAGFIFPGDRVDVILTHGFSRQDIPVLTDRRISETILENVRVLALDQRSDNLVSDPKVAQLATLEVSPKDAEKLAMAVDIGQGSGKTSIMLALRSLPVDEPNGKAPNAEKQGPTWDSDVSRSYPTINGDDGLVHSVKIMRGNATTENIFDKR